MWYKRYVKFICFMNYKLRHPVLRKLSWFFKKNKQKQKHTPAKKKKKNIPVVWSVMTFSARFCCCVTTIEVGCCFSVGKIGCCVVADGWIGSKDEEPTIRKRTMSHKILKIYHTLFCTIKILHISLTFTVSIIAWTKCTLGLQ